MAEGVTGGLVTFLDHQCVDVGDDVVPVADDALVDAAFGERILVVVEQRGRPRHRNPVLLVLAHALVPERLEEVGDFQAGGLDVVIQRRDCLVQVELEPPDVGQRRDFRHLAGLQGGGQLLRRLLVGPLELVVDLDIRLGLVESLDELLLGFAVDAALRRPPGDLDGPALDHVRRGEGGARLRADGRGGADAGRALHE